jgi:hypothetical protein
VNLGTRRRQDVSLPVLNTFTDFSEVKYRNRGARIGVCVLSSYSCFQMSSVRNALLLEPFTLVVLLTSFGK